MVSIDKIQNEINTIKSKVKNGGICVLVLGEEIPNEIPPNNVIWVEDSDDSYM